jgi:exonuclease SbcC
MRLLSIELNDFQVHEKTTIEFTPSITTIKGPTDAGKSAVLRALRWACLNDLSGDEFIREDQKRTKIVLRVRHDKRDWEVIRIKSISSTGINVYKLNGDEFKSFATSVPTAIAEVLQLSELNFQSQHDSPFWFCETAGEVSRRLNSIVDLSVIDTTLSNIASAVRQAQERQNICSERLAEAKQEFEKVKDAEARVEEFKNLKGAHEKFAKAEADHHRMEGLIRDVNTRRDLLRRTREQEAEGTSVLDSCRKILDSSKKISRINEIIGQMVYQSSLATPPPSFSPVEKAFNEWQEVQERTEGLSKLVSQCKETTTAVEEWDKKAAAAERKYHQETKGKRCPLCGKIS